MVLEDTLFVLLRRIPPEYAIKAWCNSKKTSKPSIEKPLALFPDENSFCTALQNQFPHYSVNEAEYAYQYAKEISKNCNDFETGIFGLIAETVKDLLITDGRNECLCKYKKVLEFRELTHPIDPLLFVAAFLAKNDIKNGYERKVFSWPLNLHTDNERLNHLLDKGVAENHFHIGGSSSAFLFSWICLMNNYSEKRKKEFAKENLDGYSLDSVYAPYSGAESYYSLTFKAVCIRLFLFLRMRGQWVVNSNDEKTEDELRQENEDWLFSILSASEAECDMYTVQVNEMLDALKMLHNKQGNDFVADYASCDEADAPWDDADAPYYHGLAVRNYERRLFHILSGEQRFLYNLFAAVYRGDATITPYLDVAYAYLLIYCKLRSELMQVNNRVGFGNFLKYQDRKELFTDDYPEYAFRRNVIAQQSVLLNPQIVSFEGRMGPADTADKLIEKISNLYNAAKFIPIDNEQQQEYVKSVVDKKLHYVLHFPKKAQEYNGDNFDYVKPRDHMKREQVGIHASAIIEAVKKNPKVMSLVTGIDACSNEIDCRPEVFAPSFRMIRQYRYGFDDYVSPQPYRNMRITYHAGEDFLDPVDGLRAIDEAIAFLEMRGGDRLGHALALGIDCEEWYCSKRHTVLLKKQALLDNLTWLYGKMHQYDIQNNAAEDQIYKWFKKLYTEIYTNNLKDPRRSLVYSIDVLDYYSSQKLRGNDPFLYYQNPDGSKEEQNAFLKDLNSSDVEMWRKRYKAGKNYDMISNALYHYYHFHAGMKADSDKRIEYAVPKCIIDSVCMVQEKMQYDISLKNIGIECNPSSNWLIGTFKDYLKHPIFRFNNKHLYAANDPRFNLSNPRLSASINTDDLGIFDTTLENEFALMACALERHNQFCDEDKVILPDNIYAWLDYIRQQGCEQSFIHIDTK